jgi:hypothetical protein
MFRKLSIASILMVAIAAPTTSHAVDVGLTRGDAITLWDKGGGFANLVDAVARGYMTSAANHCTDFNFRADETDWQQVLATFQETVRLGVEPEPIPEGASLVQQTAQDRERTQLRQVDIGVDLSDWAVTRGCPYNYMPAESAS